MKVLLLPYALQHLRTLYWYYAISKVLQNIQFAQGVKFKKCKKIPIILADIDSILNALDNQPNTEKRFSMTKKSFLSLKLEWNVRHRRKKTYPFVFRKIKKTRHSVFFVIYSKGGIGTGVVRTTFASNETE